MVYLTRRTTFSAAGIDMVHIPYKGTAPGVVDLLAGQVLVMAPNVPSSITGRKLSCWLRLKRWISSMNSRVPCPILRRCRAARFLEFLVTQKEYAAAGQLISDYRKQDRWTRSTSICCWCLVS